MNSNWQVWPKKICTKPRNLNERLVVFDGCQLGGGVAAAVQTVDSDQHSPRTNEGV